MRDYFIILSDARQNGRGIKCLDDARYIQNWLKVLPDNNRAVVTAVSKAQEMVTYLQQLAAFRYPAPLSGVALTSPPFTLKDEY
jgi:antirestriction protein ArdC